MKPDWKDAPEWANYLAMDTDKRWFWYENEPELYRYGWSPTNGRVQEAVQDVSLWGIKQTLEERPIVVSADSVRYDYERAVSRTKRGDVL